MKSEPRICNFCHGSGRKLNQRELGFSLWKKRMSARVSQVAVANLLRITASYLSDLEHGRRNWTHKKVTKYLSAIERLSPPK